MSSSDESASTPLKRALLAIDKLQQKIAGMQKASTEPIAIVGMGCRLPGGINDPNAYWDALRSAQDMTTEIPPDRWDRSAMYSEDRDEPGRFACQRGAFLRDVGHFDPEFFGISPREAVHIDPQHRLMLEVSWEALERASVVPSELKESRTGVFVGIMTADYASLHVKAGYRTIDGYFTTGNELSFAAGRLSYVLGLHGPSMSVDTACSSSLVATHLACQSLRARECDLALAGGVSLILSPVVYLFLSKVGALAPDGRCKTFDASADGMGRGEGCGVIVLKRLSDALAAGDRILGTILSSAVNHDGPSGGLTVPSGPAQQQLVRSALLAANLSPADISFIEAHGTGTALGDPIEVNALGQVFGEVHQMPEVPILLGSSKACIGHLDSAAGIAGLIKAVLVLQHGYAPPQPHVRTLNPSIPWSHLPFRVPTELLPLPAGRRPWIAGVSSFGLSGVNAHTIVQRYPS